MDARRRVLLDANVLYTVKPLDEGPVEAVGLFAGQRRNRHFGAEDRRDARYGWPQCQDHETTRIRWNEQQQQHEFSGKVHLGGRAIGRALMEPCQSQGKGRRCVTVQ